MRKMYQIGQEAPGLHFMLMVSRVQASTGGALRSTANRATCKPRSRRLAASSPVGAARFLGLPWRDRQPDMDYGSREHAARDLEGNLWSFGTHRPEGGAGAGGDGAER
jgi:hypothetical protein